MSSLVQKLLIVSRTCFDQSCATTCVLPLIDQRISKNNVNVNITEQIRYKSYKRFLDYSKLPKLEENELEEQHVRGSGPGGQATNKTSNAVILKHVPTGLVVKCHETRSLSQNRKIARELLLKKLDNLINGEESLEKQEERLSKRDSIKKQQKQKKMTDLKKAFEERENLK
ncbi:probable peptide chain release factor C12orf65, mitochondrial [Ceratina calcarata]|uniref:Probable peptide chain release factor C12orf65, mitochondrial n=1 Tax=Ceratina calcarata TaxID=156304 RepID=A0AAJ7JH94_9HYME|nr:probable peptide chain release factor C12orf65, mitochondrial [Ceratina calcarata]